MKAKKEVEVPSYRWAGVVVRHADADESDSTEDSVTMVEKIGVEDLPPFVENKDVEVNPIICRNMRMSAEPGYVEDMLSPMEARHYTLSAVTTARGRMLHT